MTTQAERPATSTDRNPPVSGNDGGYGLVILSLTMGGSLLVTTAVWLIALHPTAWVAGFALAMLIVMAAAIVAAVMSAIRLDRDDRRDAPIHANHQH